MNLIAELRQTPKAFLEIQTEVSHFYVRFAAAERLQRQEVQRIIQGYRKSKRSMAISTQRDDWLLYFFMNEPEVYLERLKLSSITVRLPKGKEEIILLYERSILPPSAEIWTEKSILLRSQQCEHKRKCKYFIPIIDLHPL